MKFSTAVVSASALAATAYAADDAVVEFVTVLVNDLKANQPQYLGYVATAKDVPPQVTQLALAVLTYTDLSYTTLIPGLDVPSIQAFAAGLPWFSRIEAAITPLGGAASSAPAKTDDVSASATSAPASSAPAASAPAVSGNGTHPIYPNGTATFTHTGSTLITVTSCDEACIKTKSHSKPPATNKPTVTTGGANQLVGAGLLSFGAIVAALI